MFRKELLLLYAVAASIFLIVGGVSAWLTRVVAYESTMIVSDTLPGLVNAGEALHVMDDKWNRSCNLVFLPTAEARSNAIVQLRTLNTSEYWAQYEASIFAERDRQLFARVQVQRTNCLLHAEKYYQLINAGEMAAAAGYLQGDLLPAYVAYRDAAHELFKWNKATGEARSRRILQMSTWLPAWAGLTAVLVFAGGFILGLRGAFTGLEYLLTGKRG